MAALMLAAPAAGCSLFGEEDTYTPSVVDPADLLYNQGLAAIRERDFEKAKRRFDAIDTQYPGTEWGRRGILMSAYAAYAGGQYDDAIIAAERYVTLYPDTPDTPYAAYIFANANYAQIPDVTRDQERTIKAMQAFRLIVERWPKSEYAEDSRFKIQVTMDQLAAKEMQVGRFYLENKNYAAALNRFKVVVSQFQQTRQVEEALSRMTEAYMAMGLTEEAQTAAAILGHNYPSSQWYKDAYTLVKSNGLEPRENTDSWLSRTMRGLITL